MPASVAMRSMGMGATDWAISISLGTRALILVSLRAVADIMLFDEMKIGGAFRSRPNLGRFRRRGGDLDQRFAVTGAAVAIEKIVDIGTGALQGAVAWRNISGQFADAVGGFGALVNRNPDARPVGQYFAHAVEWPAAGTIAQIFGAGHGADHFEVPQHAVAASVTAEDRLLECHFQTFETSG